MFAFRPSTLAGRLVLAFATLITLMLGLALAGWLAGRGGDPHTGTGLVRMHQAIMALGLLGAVAGLAFAASLLRSLRHQQRLLEDAGLVVSPQAHYPLQFRHDRHGQADEHDPSLNTLPGFKTLSPHPAASPARPAQPAAYVVRRPAAGAGSSAPAGAQAADLPIAGAGAGAGRARLPASAPTSARSTTSSTMPGVAARPDQRADAAPDTDAAADAELARLQLAVSQLQLSLRDVVRGVRDKAARAGAGGSAGTPGAGVNGAPGATRADPAATSAAASAPVSAADAAPVPGRAARRRLADTGPSLVVDHAVDAAQRSAEVVSQVVGHLDEISTASRRIADTIGVIDSIAFQTNLLALNATVEAARAGEQGSAAAAAAADVRMLAQRAASAAREIRSLIAGTLARLEGVGHGLADKGHTMETIVGSVQCVTDIVGHLSQAPVQPAAAQGQGAADAAPAPGQCSAEQLSVAQLEQMTRQNTQLVQQSSSAAESLRLQAERLQKVVAAFRLLQQTQQAAWTAHSAIADARRSARLGGPPTPAGAPGAAPLSRRDGQDDAGGLGGLDRG